MEFGFQLFGLLMMFLLVVVFYLKKDSMIRGNKIFRCSLLTTYIMQLCICAMYITRMNELYNKTFEKFYLITVMLWFALLWLYFVEKIFKDSAIVKKGQLKSGMNTYLLCFIGIQIVSGIAILLAPVSMFEGMIDYSGHMIIYFISCYLFLEFIVLLIGFKKIDKEIYLHLLVIFLIQVVSCFLQTRSSELPILNIGIIFVMFYTYFMLEDISKLELRRVKLERDYAVSQSMDKVSFLKNLSHEIRTPINTIDGFSQVILGSEDMKEIKGDVEYIRLASRDLIDVINGMIDLSIIESGSLEIINENYNVYDMIDEIYGIVNAKIKDQKINFQLDVEEDLPEILFGDSERISQVILNLLMNFIKYTDQGTIFLEVECIKGNSKCRLKFVIKSDGSDIKRDELNQVLLNKDTTEGTNFGLTVSTHLISLMGGKMEVNYEYKESNLVTVTFDQKIISEKQEKQTRKKKEVIPFYDSKKRILIVDDNKLNLKVASKLLSPYGVQIVEANSGQECLDILEKDTNFDLILMDDLMPEMSGTETLDIIKKIERIDGYYIPVVALTANAVTGMKEKYLEVGFEDYLAKPIDKYELDRILKKYLKGKGNFSK